MPKTTNNSEAIDEKKIVELIDKLAPLNNEFRLTEDPIKKIETMWEFGKVLDQYLSILKTKLHTLLYKIYDPYSNVKMSYITRDAGSYSYRIYKYFSEKASIRTFLNGLTSYMAFREAIPLIFNPSYKLDEQAKQQVLYLIKSDQSSQAIVDKLRLLKKQIKPINNPRNQNATAYDKQKEYLDKLESDLKTFYLNNNNLPEEKIINKTFYGPIERQNIVSILMALASDSLVSQLKNIQKEKLNINDQELFDIASSNNMSRSRFRKWVKSHTELLRLSEAIHSLNDENNYKFFRTKFIN